MSPTILAQAIKTILSFSAQLLLKIYNSRIKSNNSLIKSNNINMIPR